MSQYVLLEALKQQTEPKTANELADITKLSKNKVSTKLTKLQRFFPIKITFKFIDNCRGQRYKTQAYYYDGQRKDN